MARPPRIQYPDAIYHVLNRGLAHQRVFHESRDYEQCLDGVSEAHARWRVEVARPGQVVPGAAGAG